MTSQTARHGFRFTGIEMGSLVRRCLVWSGLVLLATPLVAAFSPAGTDQGDAVEAGRDVYMGKCASCHGEAATGHGPASRTLRQQPADLTSLSNRARPFDRETVRAAITGRIRLVPAHGTVEMPYWRSSLDTAAPAVGGGITELDALLTYLETIQREPFGLDPGISSAALARSGAPLFATYCAGCHGSDGRGLPAPADPAASPRPDLTTMALRNGGNLDIRRLSERIANGNHGDREMPAWDRAFRKAGWPAIVAAQNIQAIARYVESIQQR